MARSFRSAAAGTTSRSPSPRPWTTSHLLGTRQQRDHHRRRTVLARLGWVGIDGRGRIVATAGVPAMANSQPQPPVAPAGLTDEAFLAELQARQTAFLAELQARQAASLAESQARHSELMDRLKSKMAALGLAPVTPVAAAGRTGV